MTEKRSKFQFKRASEIVVPDQYFHPVATGYKDADELLSEIGGWIPSQSVLVSGPAGSGKTSLMIALNAMIAGDNPVAFVNLEMSEFQLKFLSKKIKGFDSFYVTDEFDQDETFKYLAELKPTVVIIDSLQKAARKMRNPNGSKMPFNPAQVDIVAKATKFAKDNWCIVLLIGHCTKSGDYKGPTDLEHDVDSHLRVKFDKELQIRNAEFVKNRFGGMIGELSFGITGESVWIGTQFAINYRVSGPRTKPKQISNSDSDSIEDTEYEEIETIYENELPSKEKVKLAFQYLENEWNGAGVRTAISAIIDVLKEYDTAFATDSVIKDPKKVRLSFRGGNLGVSFPDKGEITFGNKIYTEKMKPKTIGTAKEKRYFDFRVDTEIEMLTWVVIHEWCHLYEGMNDHNYGFFDLIAIKYDWFQKEIIGAKIKLIK